MVPSYFIKIDKMPLNANGKIDKKLLPEPKNLKQNKEIIKPRNLTDKFLVDLLEDLLKAPNISIDDSFFDLGGDSLNAINFCTIINQKFNKQISIQDIFKKPIISEISDLIDNSMNCETNYIPKAKEMPYYPISSAQKRIYFSSIMSNVYNITGGLELSEQIDEQKVEKIFNKLIKRHESLRTYFEVIDGNVVQKILKSATIKIEKFTENENIDNIIQKFDRNFDLSKAPLIRIGLVNNGNTHLLLLSLHHIIADGTSLNILVNEFCKLYKNEKLNNIKTTYKDYSIYENKLLESSKINDAKNYWINQFKNGNDILNLPTNYSRPPLFTHNGNKIYQKLDSSITSQILNFCQKYNVTPYMFLLSVFYILLNKYSTNSEITIGTPVANRNIAEISNIVGMFVNTLALKSNINTSDSFLKFLGNVKENCIQAFSHQEYPFDELVKNLDLNKNTSRNPLFDVMFTYQNNGNPEINLNGITAKYFKPDTNISKFDLSLEIIPIETELELTFEYCTDLFNKKFIQELSCHYITLLKNILEAPLKQISEFTMLSKNEENKIINKYNKTNLDFDKNSTIISMFKKQVKKHPNKTAVIFENQKLNYKELDEKSNQIANYLVKQNISNNNIVGIMFGRSIEILVCMLGILKTGAAYLPIDPTYPEARINYIIKNSNVKIILTEPNLIVKNENCKYVDAKIKTSKIYSENTMLEKNIEKPSDLAYVIYTSGSTGNPKGVMITVENVVNFVYGILQQIEFKPNTIMGSLTTMCFDIFVLESLLPIMIGITTVIANFEEQTIPQKLNDMCKKNNITVLQTTPSKFLLLLSDENSLDYVKNLEYILLGGEAFSPTLLPKIKKLTNARIFNMYGPTETTVWSFIKELTNSNTITIGKPLANQSFYILDENLNILPTCIPGNLYIGGLGITNGYLGREDLTKERFIENPFIPGERIYNTGDIVKLLQNGEVSYIGRSDFQVKVNGLRIELRRN